MKKLFLLFVLSLVFFAVEAQNKTVTILEGKSFGDATMTAADTVAAGRTTYHLVFNAAQNYKLTQNLMVHLDSISTPNVTVQLQGSVFPGQSYANIGSAVTWAGTTADTTIYIANATANRYRYFKVLFTRNAGKALIYDAQLKLWYE
jgi:hypothetical protein